MDQQVRQKLGILYPNPTYNFETNSWQTSKITSTHFFSRTVWKSRTGKVKWEWLGSGTAEQYQCAQSVHLSTGCRKFWVQPSAQREREKWQSIFKRLDYKVNCVGRLKEWKHMIGSMGIGWAKASRVLSQRSIQHWQERGTALWQRASRKISQREA